MVTHVLLVTSFLDYVLILILAFVYRTYLLFFLKGNCGAFSVVFKSVNHISQLSHNVKLFEFQVAIFLEKA